ncbi:MAG TPA: HlyD family secretion protein [Verrucomicrobiae bacterium]|jgi:membrane fusion protein, multidrug efflux system|nr:HlyD family secretion protein [Verrucomicrobiae bacterium]
MDQTTQSPPEVEKKDAETKPLPSTEKDFRTRPSRTESSGFRIAVVIGILILLVVGFFVYRYMTSYESTDDAQVDGYISSISARVSGHVIKLNVTDNQYVKAGEVLVELDPTDYQVAYDRAKADFEDAHAAAVAAGVNVPITDVNTTSQLSSSEADVSSARAAIQAAKQQFAAAKAQLQEAQANNQKTQSDLERYRQLVGKQEISQQQFETAQTTAQASAAAVEGARATADAAQQQVTQAEGRLVQAESNFKYARTAPKQMQAIRARASEALAGEQQKKAALDQAALNLQYTKIVAPMDGVVSDRTVDVGQNVSPGQELMKDVDLDDVWITANYKETQLREMKIGQRADIKVDAYDRTYKGKVQSIAGASGARFSLLPPENATGNYVKVVQRIPVKIVLDPGSNKDHQLRPGMSVEPKVWIRE